MGRKLYTVYDNRTDLPVAVCETSDVCCKVMGVQHDSFHCLVNKSSKGCSDGRWSIVKEGYDYTFDEDVIKRMPSKVSLASISHATNISTYYLRQICSTYSIPIITEGVRKMNYIERDKFLRAMRKIDRSK